MNRLVSLACLALVLASASNATAAQPKPAAQPQPMQSATAIFAGGCFWCVEADFEKLPGVAKAESGYIGGHVKNPTYEQVGRGGTGHAEAVRVYYDPQQVTYQQLLEYFWHHIDPTVQDRQFCDVGAQYRTAIFYQDQAQREAAEASLAALQKSGRFEHIYTQIVPAGPFYVAEDYHQDYYKKSPIRYGFYRKTCGRDARVEQVWNLKH